MSSVPAMLLSSSCTPWSDSETLDSDCRPPTGWVGRKKGVGLDKLKLSEPQFYEIPTLSCACLDKVVELDFPQKKAKIFPKFPCRRCLVPWRVSAKPNRLLIKGYTHQNTSRQGVDEIGNIPEIFYAAFSFSKTVDIAEDSLAHWLSRVATLYKHCNSRK